MAGGAGETTLEYTPTWVVAIVCTVIVGISLIVERGLHYTGKYLKGKNQKPLYESLLKIKEELMLLGFISLLLTVTQDRIQKICIPEHLGDTWLPCNKNSVKTTDHWQMTGASFFFPTTTHYLFSEAPVTARRLLAEEATNSCGKGKVPLLSLTALHHLHIFIFVLAVAHVIFSVLTIILGGAKIRSWKHWEESILKDQNSQDDSEEKFIHVQDHAFIKGRFLGFGKDTAVTSWLLSFFKQFFGSVTKSDYRTLRLGFITTHCKGNPKFNFYKYMIRALEADFKKVVGISWYLWLFVVVFLLLNVQGWHAYFWIAFIPLILLLAVGTKLEHVITQLAHEVAEKHVAVQGELVVNPSDDHFWFNRPRLVLILIHIILFQNSFEIAFFCWILVQYGWDSCIMGAVGYIIPRLVIGVFVQFLCSYSTLPLYAIVTQMGTFYKSSIFEEHIQVGIIGWAAKAKKNKGVKKVATNDSNNNAESSESSVQMTTVSEAASTMEEGQASEIRPSPNPKGATPLILRAFKK
ncbi:MLO-like protein 15 [Impatiens glandulifera]|uniref:MLO-like protein 15 n=1 Tax=Impatiens glandulifera TaxID=253017 RepID=UPI001FB14E42|nr:MLO-like protein 15 [Impatiens glandulifera]